jgi:nucleotide-binding universal stress UspA family protein
MNTNLPDVEGIEKEAKALFKRFMNEADERFNQRPTTRVAIKSGVFPDVLIGLSKDELAYAILMPGKDAEGHYKKMLAGPGGKVLENAECPVWILPPEPAYDLKKDIVYATRMNENDLHAIQQLAKIASPRGTTIQVLYLVEDKEKISTIEGAGWQELAREKTGYNKITYHARENKSLIQGINDFADEINAGMVSIMQEEKGFLEELFASSESKELVLEADLPVIIFHEM